MNVLVTSAGRRTSLVMAFKSAVKAWNGIVVAGDIDGLAPALYMADYAVQLPRVHDVQYIPHLLELVDHYKIRLLIPTIDTELATLAEHQAEFLVKGCRINISSSEFVATTADKWLTVQRFGALDIPTPVSWLPEALPQDLPEHVFIKPRNGSASINAFAVQRSDLFEYIKRVPNLIIQQYINAAEYTVDALLDFAGNPIHYVPRLRIRTLAGESIQGKTVDDGRYATFLQQTLAAAGYLGARGAITVQFFDSDAGCLLSEINPRFGGGFPLGLASGARYPEWLLAMVVGEYVKPCLGEYERGVYMTRSSVELFTKEPKWVP